MEPGEFSIDQGLSELGRLRPNKRALEAVMSTNPVSARCVEHLIGSGDSIHSLLDMLWTMATPLTCGNCH